MALLPAYLLYEILVPYPFSISTVLKTYGQHLKAPAAMVRLRLYETLSLLPSHAFEGKFYIDEYRIELISLCYENWSHAPFTILIACTEIEF
jgi:hypothetical protein